MIQDWRDRWGQGDLPFYFVQIAPFHYKTNPMSAAFLREAQGMALAPVSYTHLTLPTTLRV